MIHLEGSDQGFNRKWLTSAHGACAVVHTACSAHELTSDKIGFSIAFVASKATGKA